jgi:hypothetical protein
LDRGILQPYAGALIYAYVGTLYFPRALYAHCIVIVLGASVPGCHTRLSVFQGSQIAFQLIATASETKAVMHAVVSPRIT